MVGKELKLAVGRIVRLIAGFFYVEPLQREMPLVECSARGKLKLASEAMVVGDQVEFDVENGKGVITQILPRVTLLKRPYIANVNLLVLVFAQKDPDPNDLLISKFLILAESSGIPCMIVFNKTDLVTPRKANLMAEIYRNIGYQVLCTSVKTHLGKLKLKKALTGKIAVFAGPSGVGKSALLNLVAPGFELQTGAVSEKIRRGKHTTREVQLLRTGNESYIADTPGFTQIALDFIEPEQLTDYFIEFDAYRHECKFISCCHDQEPQCGVKEALAKGKINEFRYRNYLQILGEIREAHKKRYR
jgi:ribosome biogenesis GTPase